MLRPMFGDDGIDDTLCGRPELLGGDPYDA